MTGPLIWLIYLLTYSDTEQALLGSRRLFGVNGSGVAQKWHHFCTP